MALTAAQLIDARTWVVQRLSDDGPVNYTKTDIETTLAAATTWIETNAASFVTALAGTPMSGATQQQKVAILIAAVIRRYGVRN